MPTQNTCLLDIFGIQFEYLPTWRIIPDSAYSLNYDSGLFRFEENVPQKRSRISLGVRWECSQTDGETFLEEFGQDIEAEYHKALKGKGRQFELLRNEIVETPHGVRMRVIETQYKATQALVHDPRKMQRLWTCNVAFYCEVTHRIVICSLVSVPAYVEENREQLEALLLSVRTHPVYSAEFEAERMEKRARQRMAASKKAASPLAAFSGLLKRKASV